MVIENDEVIAIKASGQITRSAVSEVPVKGRDTMGVKFVGVNDDDSVVVIARNPEQAEDPEAETETTEDATSHDSAAAPTVADSTADPVAENAATTTDSAESVEDSPAATAEDGESETGDGVEEDEQ